MAQCMNALADKVHVHKQKVPCTHGYAPHTTWSCYSTTIPTSVALNLVPTGVPLLLI